VQDKALANSVTRIKYLNRRIHDTELSEYFPFSSISKRMMDARTMLVVNHRTKDDATREVLTNFILEKCTLGKQ
jgi:polyhydroxyalkanoate synthesis regulator protein